MKQHIVKLEFQHSLIGIDEAGRGCLAGPVVAGAVFFPPHFDAALLPGLNDSKKLSPQKREILRAQIVRHCIFGIGLSWPREIDRINILQATFRAMSRATQALYLRMQKSLAKAPVPTAHSVWPLSIDGPYCIPLAAWQACSQRVLPKQQAVVGGDAKVAAIAAASILAKTTRDALMIQFHTRFPVYGFQSHKGYGAKVHLTALERHGACRLHRMTFRKVRPDGEKNTAASFLGK